MNIRIYSIEYRDPLSPEIWQPLLARLPVDILQKVGKYKRWQDAHACLFGKHLLLAALRKEGFRGDLNDLVYSIYDRPYLENGPDFNISHSGNRVVCIVGNQGGVGIDLEEIRELNFHDFEDQFSAGEWETILGAKEPLTVFYQYWTAKECILKADGRGLNWPLAKLEIGYNTGIRLDDRSWNLRSLSFFKDYACHIATEKWVAEPVLVEFTPAGMLDLSYV